MGEFRFRVPEFWDLDSRYLRTVHVVGLDGIPKPCKVQINDGVLLIVRNENESAKTYVAFPFSQRGDLTVCSGTLLESKRTYDLTVELARGTINRLRNQTSIWEEGGLEIPAVVKSLTARATESLCSAIVSPVEEKDRLARQALENAIDAIFELSNAFGVQISEFRVGHEGIPPIWLGISTHRSAMTPERLIQYFDYWMAPPVQDDWQQISTTQTPVMIGPILDASPHAPNVADAENFEECRRNTLATVDELLHRMPKNVSLIQAACGLNGIGQRNLSYRQQSQLTTEILARIEDKNAALKTLVSFDYPWAEKLAWSVGGIHPLQIADDLIRNGSCIDFLGLDINLDYSPCGSNSRDPLQWIDLIDLWSQLGLPLVLLLRVPNFLTLKRPSNERLDRRPKDDVTIQLEDPGNIVSSAEENQRFNNSVKENLNDQQRLDLLKTLLPMIVARPGVQGIIWRQWSDADDCRFPGAGITDEFGAEKQLSSIIQWLSRDILKRD